MSLPGGVAMSRTAAGLLLGAAVAANACSHDAPARAEWLVHLSTDAPVPQFGEQIAVEILDGRGAIVDKFLDASSPGLWPVSFGVVPSDPKVAVRLRVRFFRLSTTAVGTGGLPGGTSFIDATAALPAPVGLTHVNLVLAMTCFGVPADADGHRTCDPSTGALGPEPTLVAGELGGSPLPGSWPPAATVPCAGSVPDGMVCVPGGAFLLGSTIFPPMISLFETGLPQSFFDPSPERVVELAPFALDLDEVAVGTVRALVTRSGLGEPPARDPNPATVTGMCTYVGRTDASNDAMPANCIDWDHASQACALLGKRLPAEAEWEYAARNLTRQTQYPWGTDPSACDYARVAHGQFLGGDATNCELESNGFSIGPAPGGSSRDRTTLGILNLGGNMSEWVQDVFDSYADACWQGSLLVDPTCKVGPAAPPIHSLRGGNWRALPDSALAFLRGAAQAAIYDSMVGFRCAVSM
jgi:sulfatase modifying factor 1